MKKEKGILENIEIPMYKTVVNLLVHKDCRKAAKMSTLLKPIYKDYAWETGDGWYIGDEELNLCTILLRRDATIVTITHECFHATMDILRRKGVIYCRKSEESFSHLHGWLVGEVVKIMEQQ